MQRRPRHVARDTCLARMHTLPLSCEARRVLWVPAAGAAHAHVVCHFLSARACSLQNRLCAPMGHGRDPTACTHSLVAPAAAPALGPHRRTYTQQPVPAAAQTTLTWPHYLYVALTRGSVEPLPAVRNMAPYPYTACRASRPPAAPTLPRSLWWATSVWASVSGTLLLGLHYAEGNRITIFACLGVGVFGAPGVLLPTRSSCYSTAVGTTPEMHGCTAFLPAAVAIPPTARFAFCLILNLHDCVLLIASPSSLCCRPGSSRRRQGRSQCKDSTERS